jgi:hypothetical protein
MAYTSPKTWNPGDILTAADMNTYVRDNTLALIPGGVDIIIDGGGAVITTGVKAYLEVKYKCIIKRVTLLADQTGSIQIDIWKDTYANFPPTDADSICGGNEPAISSGQKYQDSTLSGWTTQLNEGDILAINVDSVTGIQRLTISIKVERN